MTFAQVVCLVFVALHTLGFGFELGKNYEKMSGTSYFTHIFVILLGLWGAFYK